MPDDVIPTVDQLLRIAPAAVIVIVIAGVTVYGVLRVQRFTMDMIERLKKHKNGD